LLAKGLIMKIYLAAHYSRKEEIRQAAKDLEEAGIDVTSTWFKERTASKVSMNDVSETFCRTTAARDKDELDESTHFVLFSVHTDFKFTRGGHCWENGYADAKGLVRVVVGPRQHIFHYLPGTKRFDTWAEALAWLIKEKECSKHTSN
jgi:hypothetical protein